MGKSGDIPDLKNLVLNEFPILSLSFVPFTISEGVTRVPPQDTRKNTQGLGPIKSTLSRSPQPRCSYRKQSYGGQSIPSSNYRFPQVGGN